MLNVNQINHTLGEIIINLKTLTKKWLSELLQKFHFLLSYWQPAYSYGLTLTQQTQPKWQMQQNYQSLEDSHVCRVSQHTHSALPIKRKRQLHSNNNSSGSVSGGYQKLNNLSDSLKLEGFKIRIFNGLYTFWDNKRLRWGMLLLLLLAPASKFIYMLFPEEGFGQYLLSTGPIQIVNSIEGLENGWYFNTISMYLWSVGELLAPVLSVFGIFLLFPKKYYPSYLVGVPFGYYFSMLIHRMFFVTDYNSFHGGATTTMTLSFLLLGVVFFMVSDKVLFRKNHGKRASEARIIGLINMPGMKWNDKEEIIRKEVAEAMKVDNELFIRETA
jgi:hypothetical protein